MSPKLRLLALAASAAAFALPSTAQAGVLTISADDCPAVTSDQVFRPWWDFGRYVAAPGGNAESAADWAELSGGADVQAGNEPFQIGGGGSQSLRLPAGSAAATQTMCVGVEYPTMRFFVRSSGTGLLSSLLVEAQVQTTLGLWAWLPIGVVPPSSSWTPTAPYAVVANLLPLLPGERTPIRYRFSPIGTGTWSVDDVYVDPYRTR